MGSIDSIAPAKRKSNNVDCGSKNGFAANPEAFKAAMQSYGSPFDTVEAETERNLAKNCRDTERRTRRSI